ncbi:MAG: lamin tail domain-containing protein [Bacteroidales bacterium]
MAPKTIMTILCMVPLVAWGQLHDSFSDGNFSSNPIWSGHTNLFVVEQGMLRLNDSQPGYAFLVTQNTMIESAQWDFWVRLAFTPSTNNHPKIFLTSNSHQLDSILNGYYIQIGKDGTDNKRLFFFRQDGDASVELMAGTGNIATGSNNKLHIRATRDKHGNWALFADPAGGNLMMPQGEVFDNTHTTTSWFGISCRYTISNSNRFWFDDFYVGDIIPDHEPFRVNNIKVMAANALEVSFNKIVEPVSAQKVPSYFVNHEVGMPLIAGLDDTRPNIVNLVFEKNFPVNLLHELHIVNVKDLAGNVMDPFIGEFVYYKSGRFDVVFNELMVDPTPEVGLPGFEYIELANTTDLPINLEGWILQHGEVRKELPDCNIPAGGLLVLTTEDAMPFLQDYGNVVSVAGWSSTALTNAGTSLLLFDPDQQLISFVSYTDRWYADPARDKGGWSLEKIDPLNDCQGAENWKASNDPLGGTPATPNSVLAVNHDVVSPRLLRAGYLGPQTITLFFSEPMDELSLIHPEHYQIVPLPGLKEWLPHPVAVHPELPDFSRVTLQIGQPLEPGTIYEVRVQNLTDCAANPLYQQQVLAAVPEPAHPLDVVINEILFNPSAGGARYAELYNRSSKVIDLSNYLLCSHDTVAQTHTSLMEISTGSYLFFPDTWLVITPDPEAVKLQFMTPHPDAFLGSGSLPGTNNTGGILVLAHKSLEVIDRVVFHQEMHLPLLTSTRGVSLERLNPSRPSADQTNWHSAAQSAGFGTPAYQNSQFTLNQDQHPDPVEIYPLVFTPDGDGQQDVLNISYAFEKAGLVANVRIYDSRGRMVRLLQQAELLATKGVITWNGITDDSAKAPVGIYIIHLEVYDMEGNVDHYRKTAVLGSKL